MNRSLTIATCSLLLVFSGCCFCHKKPRWSPPMLVDARGLVDPPAECNAPESIRAEKLYRCATELNTTESPASVTAAYNATIAAYYWRETASGPHRERAEQIYHSSLTLMLENAQRFCRYDPHQGIQVDAEDGPQWIPIDYRGFTRPPEDFNALHVVGKYRVKELRTHYTRCGLGAPVVVERIRKCPKRFQMPEQGFSATAVLVPDGDRSRLGGQLALVAPGSAREVEAAGNTEPLAADFTAPLAYAAYKRPVEGLQGFLQPGSSIDKAKLFMVDPYDDKKIPVVFVHGLLSDPVTWVALANELLGKPWFRERYQLWAFRYPTGEPFLRSAATLRKELAAALDQSQADKSTRRRDVVLIGHSMGGLVSKLQVTDSGDRLWRTSANIPLDAINDPGNRREELRQIFFFKASPAVSRVIFVGTPHGGSSWARRSIGRLGSMLVRRNEENTEAYQEMLDANPGVFAPYLQEGLPTSVDLLEPENPLLKAMRPLPIRSGVSAHSVIGVRKKLIPCGEPSDGVVPVESAKHAGVESNVYVQSKHSTIHHHPFAMRAILDILAKHWSQSRVEFITTPPPPIEATFGRQLIEMSSVN